MNVIGIKWNIYMKKALNTWHFAAFLAVSGWEWSRFYFLFRQAKKFCHVENCLNQDEKSEKSEKSSFILYPMTFRKCVPCFILAIS